MDDNKHNDQFSAAFQLPDEAQPDKSDNSQDKNAAADLIRKKVEAAYKYEPDAHEEFQEAEEIKPSSRSKHQEFIFKLTNSGKPLHEVQAAWHAYYSELPDDQKHQVWQEFYSAHAQAAQHPMVTHQPMPHVVPHEALPRPAVHKKSAKPAQRLKQVRDKAAAVKKIDKKTAANQTLHSLLFGLGTGSIVIIIFMFSFFNDRIIAPFIQPSRNISDIPLISSAPVSSDPEVIIPKINSEVPVVYDVNSIADADIQQGLERGVVHYYGTAAPGQDGNVVIVGHSSGNIFNAGKYKFAFSLLRAVNPGDTFYLQKDGKRYVYQVYEKKVVKPTDVGVLGPTDRPATATLITCDPPGLNSSRLVVVGQQISPDVATNGGQPQTQPPATTAVIPGNSETLWSRLVKWFTS
jgi:LPXTG-site transpeptidase (sortase) family protein